MSSNTDKFKDLRQILEILKRNTQPILELTDADGIDSYWKEAFEAVEYLEQNYKSS